MPRRLLTLPPLDKDGDAWTVVIETPKHSRNKYKLDPEIGAFTLSSVLPEGHSFPYDFGFLPQTRGDDGDPLDVLLLMDAPAFPGCVIPARLIGVLEAEQTEKDEKTGKPKTNRNDRLLAVPVKSPTYADVKDVKDLSRTECKEIEAFFKSYNQQHGKRFKSLGYRGPTQAESLARAGITAYKRKHGRKQT